LCHLTAIRGIDKQRNTSNHEQLQVTNTVEEKFQYQKKRTKSVTRMEDLPLLTLQVYPRGRRDVGRPKQRWKDQQHLQVQEEVLLDLNLSNHDDGDDSDEDKLLPEKR
jgi:hypothetical protein